MDFNPNSTDTKGLEWLPSREGRITLDTGAKAVGLSFPQTTSQSIGTARLRVGAIPFRGGLYHVEVYDAEDAGINLSTLATLEAVPNEDVSGTGGGFATGTWREDDETTTTIYTEIDEGSAAISYADYIHNAGGGPQIQYNGRLNTGSLALTGKRILAVNLALHLIRNFNDNWTRIYYGLDIGGVEHGKYETVPWLTGPLTIDQSWLHNPTTNRPWTIADVQALDTSDEWFVQGEGFLGLAGGIRIYAVWLTVHVCDENRIAVGVLNDKAGGLSANAWNLATMTTPTNGTWTKDGSGQHLYVVRKDPTTNGSLVLPYIEGDAGPAQTINGWSPAVDPWLGFVAAMGDETTKIIPVIQRTTAPADSVDSQPYYDLLTGDFPLTGIHQGGYFSENGEVAQEFSNAAAADYGWIRCLIRPGLLQEADEYARIRVFRRSDNAQMGGQLTITVAELRASPDVGNGFRLVEGQLDTVATLTAATQYYFLFDAPITSGALAAVVPEPDVWFQTPVLYTDEAEPAGFGGITDRGTTDLLGEADEIDVPITIATLPTAPTLVVTAETEVAPTAAVCGQTSIDYILAALSVTSGLGVDLERSLDGAATWEAIYHRNPTSGASIDVEDREVPIGVTARYRARQFRSDGATSQWSAPVAGHRPVPACPTLTLASNYSGAAWIFEYAPDKSYDFPSAGETAIVPLHATDFQRAYRPTEIRGVVARYSLVIGSGGEGTIERGHDAFAELRSITETPRPYVCVLDHEGGRLLATVQIASAAVLEPGGRYTAEIVCTEVTATPWVEQPA